MQLRDDLCLDSAIRTLTDIVLPAVNQDDAHAQEQLQIVIGLLSLAAARGALAWRYSLDELARLLPFCQQLAALDETRHGDALASLSAEASAVLARAQAGPEDVLHAIRALREASGALIGALYREGDAPLRARLGALVLTHAEAQLTRERAWYAPQGWEPRPDALPAIEDLLG